MLNRLAELQQLTSESSPLQRQSTVKLGEKGVADQYFPVIDGVRTNIKELSSMIEKMRSLAMDLADTLDNDEEKRLEAESKSLFMNFTNACKSIHVELTDLRQDNVDFESNYGYDRETEVKIRNGMWQVAFDKLQAATDEFHAARDEFLKESHDRMRRFIATVYPDASEEEVSELINLGADAEMLQEQIRKGNVRKEQAFSDLKDTLNDIKRLERTVMDVHANIASLGALVKQQDQVIAAVCEDINDTEQYVAAANEELASTAVFKQQRDRMRLIKYLLLVVALVAAFWWFYPKPHCEMLDRPAANGDKAVCVPFYLKLSDSQRAALRAGIPLADVRKMPEQTEKTTEAPASQDAKAAQDASEPPAKAAERKPDPNATLTGRNFHQGEHMPAGGVVPTSNPAPIAGATPVAAGSASPSPTAEGSPRRAAHPQHASAKHAPQHSGASEAKYDLPVLSADGSIDAPARKDWGHEANGMNRGENVVVSMLQQNKKSKQKQHNLRGE